MLPSKISNFMLILFIYTYKLLLEINLKNFKLLQQYSVRDQTESMTSVKISSEVKYQSPRIQTIPQQRIQKSSQKKKVLAIILCEDQSEHFEQFCIQIYNQSVRMGNKKLAQIMILNTYQQFKFLLKNKDTEYYILSSQRLIDCLESIGQIKQNWVVYDSSRNGSKKRILDMPNVVYYTRQLVSLGHKLEKRKFIPNQEQSKLNTGNGINSVKKKVRAIYSNPIEAYIQQSMNFKPQSNEEINNNVEHNNLYNFDDKTRGRGFQLEKNEKTIKIPFQIHHSLVHKEPHRKEFSPKRQQNILSEQNNSSEGSSKTIIDLIKSQIEREKQNNINPMNSSSRQLKPETQNINYVKISNKVHHDIEQDNQNNSKSKSGIRTFHRTPTKVKQSCINQSERRNLGPGTNRIIDLNQYDKFLQNGIVIYRKRSNQKNLPQSTFSNEIKYNEKSYSLQDKKTQRSQNINSFNPQNATFDQKIVYEDGKDLIKQIEKPYQTCNQYNQINTNPVFYKAQEKVFQKKQEQNEQKRSFAPYKQLKRSSSQIKDHLDKISSMGKQDDYQLQKCPKPKVLSLNKSIKRPLIANLNVAHNLSNFPFPQTPERKKGKSLPMSNSKNFLRYQRLLQRSGMNSPSQRDQLKGSAMFAQSNESRSSCKKPRSLPSKTVRPMEKSMQKAREKLGLKNTQSLRFSPLHRNLANKNRIKQSKSTLSSQANQLPDTPSINSNKIQHQGLLNIPQLDHQYQIPSLVQKWSRSDGRSSHFTYRQNISILYLVDHLTNQQLIANLQSFISQNDSIYKFKNLAQLHNQIRQSNQVYDFGFVFKEQIFAQEDIGEFEKMNKKCFFVVPDKNLTQPFIVYRNILYIKDLNSFSFVLNKVIDTKKTQS